MVPTQINSSVSQSPWCGAAFVRQNTSQKQRSAAKPSLVYKRARYYDPATGEFISQDPKEYVDGMSLYRGYFVPGTVDPLGLQNPTLITGVTPNFDLGLAQGGLNFGEVTANGFIGAANASILFLNESVINKGYTLATGTPYFDAVPYIPYWAPDQIVPGDQTLSKQFIAGGETLLSVPLATKSLMANGLPRLVSRCETVTLFRGVNSSHENFASQAAGVINPNNAWWQFWKGSGSTPFQHNAVAGGTLNSPFTSWTIDPRVAVNFALRPGNTPGVVLTTQVPMSRIVVSPNTKTISLIQGGGLVSEAEVLIRGAVRGIVSQVP